VTLLLTHSRTTKEKIAYHNDKEYFQLDGKNSHRCPESELRTKILFGNRGRQKPRDKGKTL
jgi:hypothetical protein